MGDNDHLTPPLNPAITTIRDAETTRSTAPRLHVDRTASTIMQEEGNDLRSAAEQSMNVILDLDLDGRIRWASPSWQELVGTTPESIQGKPIGELLPDHQKNVFADAVKSLRKDDSGSKVVRFSVSTGTTGKTQDDQSQRNGGEGSFGERQQSAEERLIDLEAQGITIYGETDSALLNEHKH